MLSSPAQHTVVRASADGVTQPDAAHSYKDLLRRARSRPPEALLAFVADHREELTLDFLLWLANR